MLWIVGSILVALWVVEKFFFHKSGMVHVIVMIAASIYLIQFVQDRRTKAYQRSLESPPPNHKV
jgi:Family of unknown function (DUF5670)